MGGQYTEAQNRATQKYINKKYDTITVRPAKGTKDRWREEADKRNKSLNQFIVDTVEKEITK